MEASPVSDAQPLGTLWVLSLSVPAPVDPKPRLSAAFRRVDPEEASVLAETMGHNDATEVLRRFATGRRCYAARVEGTLTTFGWVTFDEEEIGEIGLRIRLTEGEAYIWDCVTVPAYRGQRLFPALLASIANELRTEGLTQIWVGADDDNRASQRGIALAGFRPVADLVLAHAGTTRVLEIRGRPGIPKHLVTDARRALLGDRDQNPPCHKETEGGF